MSVTATATTATVSGSTTTRIQKSGSFVILDEAVVVLLGVELPDVVQSLVVVTWVVVVVIDVVVVGEDVVGDVVIVVVVGITYKTNQPVSVP